jgi:hypothetical protein
MVLYPLALSERDKDAEHIRIEQRIKRINNEQENKQVNKDFIQEIQNIIIKKQYMNTIVKDQLKMERKIEMEIYEWF